MKPDATRAEHATAAKNASGPHVERRGLAGGTIRSRELFGTGRQLLIEHSGHIYLLRITQNNKLILTK